MVSIKVLLDIPNEIAEGLAKGTLKRKGGVIYDSTGGVVMWLKETGTAVERQTSGVELPPLLKGQLRSLQSLMGLQIGLQALNLGVSVAGFALLTKKTEAIDRKLDQISNTIEDIHDEVLWQGKVRNVERSADFLGALEHARWAESNEELGELISLRKQFATSHSTYVRLMQCMGDENRAHLYPEVYLSFYRHSAMAGMAKVRCDWFLNGANAALTSHSEITRKLSSTKEAFLSPMRSFDAPRLKKVPTDALPTLKAVARSLGEEENRVMSHGSEIEWCRDHSVSLSEWEQLGRAVEDRAVVFLKPISR